jgi:hypothetical protein
MSFEPVNLRVVDQSPSPSPIAGVLVKIYDSAGTFYTEGTTNELGEVGFLLSTDISYQFRFFKFQVGFVNPQRFEVLAGTSNDFTITGQVFVLPISNDIRMCRVSGFFRRISGLPAQYLDLQFVAQFNPLVLEGSAVIPERISVRTDAKGYVELDLIRCGGYEVLAQGYEHQFRKIWVPDAPSWNIAELLFARVKSVSFDPPGPYLFEPLTDHIVVPSVELSSGVPLEGAAAQEVQWDSTNPLVAAVMVDNDKLIIRTFAPGTCEITATRRDNTIVYIPDTPITGVPVSIVVAYP